MVVYICFSLIYIQQTNTNTYLGGHITDKDTRWTFSNVIFYLSLRLVPY